MLILVVAMGCWSIFSHAKGYVLHCMGGGSLDSYPGSSRMHIETGTRLCGKLVCDSVSLSLQHPGKGIDLRERKIWQLFKPKAHLEVRADVTMNRNIVAMEASKL